MATNGLLEKLSFVAANGENMLVINCLETIACLQDCTLVQSSTCKKNLEQ